VIQDLQAGKTIALLSDAGTPGIADPGSKLVKACRELGITVSGIPGACAAVLAVSISGFDTETFQFLGFLPKKTEAIKKALQEAMMYRGTSIFYESPNRLLDTLQLMHELSPARLIGVARELTKHYEEILKGTASELLLRWNSQPVKGEIVLLISGNSQPQVDWEALTPQEHVAMMQSSFGLSNKDAIKAVAELRGVPKRTIYNQLH
jgi:16S rRNA (cytidine1402-2'-O)-methyltransferase